MNIGHLSIKIRMNSTNGKQGIMEKRPEVVGRKQASQQKNQTTPTPKIVFLQVKKLRIN